MQLDFPDTFLWGCATASYQIEGSPLADGAGASIWHRFSHTPGTVANGDTGDLACDHYRRYPEDIALMRDLGLKAYRFSIAWPRVFPTGCGSVNTKGLDFYERLVDGLLAADIAPFATLYHWDLPAALQDTGGWANRDTAHRFADYAQTVFERLGDKVSHWITLNEPWVVAHVGHIAGQHAPGMRDLWAGLKAVHHQLLAHGQAVRMFRDLNLPGEIGLTLSFLPAYPASDAEEDRAAAERFQAYHNRLFSDPVFLGHYPEVLRERFANAWPSAPREDMRLIHAPVDFLGVNYYSRAVVQAQPDDGLLQAQGVPQPSVHTAMGWEVFPQGLYDLLTGLKRDYGDPAIYITENGAAFEDQLDASGEVCDGERLDYLRQHFAAAHRALAAGVRLKGYFVWSLLDNFEWAEGYRPRFGLVRVDFASQKRTVKQSGRWYKEVIARGGLEIDGKSDDPTPDSDRRRP